MTKPTKLTQHMSDPCLQEQAFRIKTKQIGWPSRPRREGEATGPLIGIMAGTCVLDAWPVRSGADDHKRHKSMTGRA